MDAGLLIQYLIVAAAVLASVWVVMKKQFPGATRRLRSTLALALLKPGRAAWMQGLGRKIAPRPAAVVAPAVAATAAGRPRSRAGPCPDVLRGAHPRMAWIYWTVLHAAASLRA